MSERTNFPWSWYELLLSSFTSRGFLLLLHLRYREIDTNGAYLGGNEGRKEYGKYGDEKNRHGHMEKEENGLS